MMAYTSREVIAIAVIDKAEDALRGVKELPNLGDSKALAESDPYVWTETISVHASDVVVLIERRRRRCEQVSGSFSNVRYPFSAGVVNFSPEFRGAEPLSDAEGNSIHHHGGRQSTSGAVIHGHAVIPSVIVSKSISACCSLRKISVGASGKVEVGAKGDHTVTPT